MSNTLPTLDLLPPPNDVVDNLLCTSLNRFETGKEKTVLFSSSLSSSSVSISSLSVFKVLLTDVLLAGWDSRLTRLASVGADVAISAGEEDEEDGDGVSLLRLFVALMTSEGLFCLSCIRFFGGGVLLNTLSTNAIVGEEPQAISDDKEDDLSISAAVGVTTAEVPVAVEILLLIDLIGTGDSLDRLSKSISMSLSLSMLVEDSFEGVFSTLR